MLIATNINKKFGTLSVLDNVNLEIKKGEIVSIVGSSGAGKTTLLQILGTLEKPDSGNVLINQTDPFLLKNNDLASFRNKNIGFIFQFHHLLPEFTLEENILLPALIHGDSLVEAKKKATELIHFLHLSERKNNKPSELSGGEQQRTAVARALINQPSVIFADEPSGNLDSKNAEELHHLFFQLRKEFNQSFVIVTHNEKLANMSDRQLLMIDGQLKSSE
ncbi:MAG: ABC transporter ATP-binding protein [Flavobacteriia bacterium]|nr:ABC transporter ATP-binding protein [Flavobacteriia bacterium]